jgi:hypothetical protein
MVTNNINYWLDEKDLKTPEHDELVLWTFNNCENLIKETISEKHKNFTIKENFYQNGKPQHFYFNFNTKKAKINSYWSDEKLNIEERKLEKEIEEDYKILEEKIKNEKREITLIKTLEKPLLNITPTTKYTIGFLDLEVNATIETKKSKFFYEEGKDSFYFNFEIKPKIYSIGEVLRQIQYYKVYTQGYFILVTKEIKIREIFESQDIKVLNP